MIAIGPAQRKSRIRNPNSRIGRRPAPCRALALVETVVSIAIVATLLVAVLNTVGAARTTNYKAAERSRGLALAQHLMGEILQQAYADPLYGPGSMGPGNDEKVPGDRSLFDDVDDYRNWSATPPQNKDGTPIPWAGGYTETVQVEWVGPEDLRVPAKGESGVKWIRVQIVRQDRVVASLCAYRTASWADPADVAAEIPP